MNNGPKPADDWIKMKLICGKDEKLIEMFMAIAENGGWSVFDVIFDIKWLGDEKLLKEYLKFVKIFLGRNLEEFENSVRRMHLIENFNVVKNFCKGDVEMYKIVDELMWKSSHGYPFKDMVNLGSIKDIRDICGNDEKLLYKFTQIFKVDVSYSKTLGVDEINYLICCLNFILDHT